MTPVVVAEGITYRRGDALLVDGIDLAVEPGQILGIVGPNGAGKSTLLQLIAGDLAPSTGSARIHDVDPSRTTPQELARLRAYLGPRGVSENPFSVRDTVAMGRHPHRRAVFEPEQHDMIVDSAMAQTDILQLADRPMASLSTGEQQRVGLARVIAQTTPVLLLDEPTAALDIGHQEGVMHALRNLARRGTTIVEILHDINLAAAHADRVMLVDRGREVASGHPADVFTSDRLSAVYDQPMRVVPHPHRDCPLVLVVDPPGRAARA